MYVRYVKEGLQALGEIKNGKSCGAFRQRRKSF